MFVHIRKTLLTLAICIAIVPTVIWCTSASAHFNLEMNIRTIHVLHTNNGLDVYVRIPTPYFLAGLVSDPLEDGTVIPAPFTFNQVEQEVLLHFLNTDEIRNSPRGFARLAADGLRIETDGEILNPQIISMRVHHAFWQPPFASLDEAKAALTEDTFEVLTDNVYVGETVTDLLLRYQYDDPINTYNLSFTFNPGLELQELTANLLLDHFPGETRIFRFTGILNDPVEISNSSLSAFATFTYQGIIHIIEGLDHLLFVICLAIGAASLTGLLWRVTGFTIGHTVTLIAGFWGFVPTGPWFIPTVELGIAISIIAVAIAAISRSSRQSDSFNTFIITTLIGLLHGLGFSFVLHELLLPDAAHLWKSLLAFNVGVEIGQVAIVTCVWVVLLAINRIGNSLLIFTRWAVALPCIVISAIWATERFMGLLGVLQLV